MPKKHLVRLTDAQRADLEGRFAGPLTLRQRNRVQVLLRADAGETDADIADDLGISAQTAANVRRRFAAEGLEAALTEKPRSGGPAILDGKGEAVLIGLACSPAPEGRTTWTARLLANKLVELQVVASVSEDTVLRVLKKARPANVTGSELTAGIAFGETQEGSPCPRRRSRPSRPSSMT